MEKMFELLQQDHREVSQMISQMQKTSGRKREQLFSQCSDALEMHMQIEEDYLYPALEDIDETKDLVRDSYEEHKMVKKQIKDMEKLNVDDQKWDAKLMAMKENIETPRPAGGDRAIQAGSEGAFARGAGRFKRPDNRRERGGISCLICAGG